MADDLFELAAELKLDKFILAGHSMGGKTAMRFAIRWPEMINSLVIVDISPFGPSSEESSSSHTQKILETILSVEPQNLRHEMKRKYP